MIRHGDTNAVQEIGKYLEDGCERIKLATGNRTAGPAEERMKERKDVYLSLECNGKVRSAGESR